MCTSACQEFGLKQEMLWVLGIFVAPLEFEAEQYSRKRIFSCVCVKILVLSRSLGEIRRLRWPVKHDSSQLLLISPSQFLFLIFLSLLA